MKFKIDNVRLELVQGDIVRQKDLDAIVNAANSQLRIGGGVAGAIHRAAGPGLEKECEPLAPIQVGEAVITGGHNLPNEYVIHTLGPVYGMDKPEAELLEKSYKNSLEIAEKNNIESIGFPAISTGAFGYPMEEAAEISLKTVKSEAEKLNNLNLIRFVLYSNSDFEVYKEKAEKIYE
ncbi:MAG: macro domain-containing protein [Bacillota bacterium]